MALTGGNQAYLVGWIAYHDVRVVSPTMSTTPALAGHPVDVREWPEGAKPARPVCAWKGIDTTMPAKLREGS
jgi:hypothetical protein